MIPWLQADVRAGVKDGFDAASVQEHLERVLASEAFRTSRRSQEFLRFVVTRTLDGRGASIKERNIAIEVFDRSEGYNSSEDSFVRVKASEVRRRLATYYSTAHEGDSLRIDLPLGSYVPQFAPLPRIEEAPSMPEPAAAAVVPRPRKRIVWTIGLILAACAVIFGVLTRQKPESELDRFWSPILRASEPLVIFLPFPTSYGLASREEAERGGQPAPEVRLPDGRTLFLALTPHKVGVGAAVGAIRFAALCARTGKQFTIKSGSDFSFADLRNQPAVLFGAFSSVWTVEINNEHRFKLVPGPGNHIVDGQNPSRTWRVTPGQYVGTPQEDYAIASRVIDSKSGRTVILAAGISTYGTQAAAEFLTDPERLKEVAQRAPGPLDRGNFQVLLHTKIIGSTPTPGRVVDMHFW